jgi:argininosuccinate synthase
MNNKVVLAFSGGLDTSFCIPYLKNEKGMEVHTVLVNTGGFSPAEVKDAEKRAIELGAASHKSVDAVAEYYDKGIKYLLFGNVLKNASYPLSVSSERMFQAMAVLDHVKDTGASYVAHGSTGAGNDQIRFDLVFEVMAPDVKIIAPVRELQLSRKDEIDYLQKHGFDFSWNKSKYSINQGMWGTSVGGEETLNSYDAVPEEAYPSEISESKPVSVSITFVKGEPVALDGAEMSPVEVIGKLNVIGGKYGVGRDMHVGDTIIGIKGRIAFEAPAALMLVKAHHLLEKHVLSKGQLYWKDQLSVWYGQLMHEAQYLDPVMRNIETFLEDTQKYVTGEVVVEMRPYHFSVVGCKSDYDMMSSRFGDYGEINDSLTANDIMGFTKVLANPLKIYYSVHKDD